MGTSRWALGRSGGPAVVLTFPNLCDPSYQFFRQFSKSHIYVNDVTNRGTDVTEESGTTVYVCGTPSKCVKLSDSSVLLRVMSQRQADTQNTKSDIPGQINNRSILHKACEERARGLH